MATSRGQRRHLVTFENPDGPPLSDGDGTYTQPYAPSFAELYAEIKPATTRELERVTSGTVESVEGLLVTTDFHPDITTQTRLSWTDPYGRAHAASVTGVNNPDGRCIDLILTAVEIVL